MKEKIKYFTCIDCGDERLVFEGSNEYEPDEVTGAKRCSTCDMKAKKKKKREIDK